MKERIIDFLNSRNGRAKTLTTYFVSGCGSYSEFNDIINEMERDGFIKRVENGEYLEVVK
ncbi:hypothetical protein [Methanothermococcus okinawensis]|uniref:ArnR1-like winged helix-turn-helix domain-containing protein n=1 Tax=Methanothermococcus okinawensis (strain DSM 14208 / JCM 11175 / IH1) TaxID=647113 RepID=F8ANT8_METOI|nr:hypothetical protein [Methanothermococcus okinawensis]AEH06291.1 hypothetical protein Metok_0301 [Methanothermococcus okinawensis IH1]